VKVRGLYVGFFRQLGVHDLALAIREERRAAVLAVSGVKVPCSRFTVVMPHSPSWASRSSTGPGRAVSSSRP